MKLSRPTLHQLGEARTVAALRQVFDRPTATDGIVVGNGDDGLVWQPRAQVVATVDSVVAGGDWLPELTPAEAIGHRAAAVNLSDLAAMGAQPRVLLVAIDAPAALPADVLVRAARQLALTADRFGCAVHGGDYGLADGPLRLTVTALGEVVGQALLRSSARAGDAVWLVGAIGQAALGLSWLRSHGQLPAADHWAQPFVAAHLFPQPLVHAGLKLQQQAAHGVRISAIDVSDGLVADAQRIARASRVGMVLEVAAPDWPDYAYDFAQQCGETAAHWCGTGGDDYALVVSAPPDFDLPTAVAECGASVQRIGRCTVGPAGAVFATVGGEVVSGKGYVHGG